MSVTRTSRGNTTRGVAGAYTLVTTSPSTSYQQLIASTSTGIYITHAFLAADGNNSNEIKMTVGIGPGASEVAIIEAPWGYTYSGHWTALNASLPFPVYVPAGTRVAMKLDYSSAGVAMGIVYVPEGALA